MVPTKAGAITRKNLEKNTKHGDLKFGRYPEFHE